MFDRWMPGALTLASGYLLACGSVAGGDPSMWQPAQGIAGGQVQFLNAQNGGAAGYPTQPPPGAGGNYVPPGGGGLPNVGGVPPYGGTPPIGGAPPGGGAPPSYGGTPPFGGSPPFGTGGDIGTAGFGQTGGAPPFGTGGDPNQPPPPPPPPGSKCSFKFDVTTTSYGGRFRPKNVGAIYIENASGGYVKSLNVWGGQRLGNLTDYTALAGADRTDAVTSATRGNAGPISGSWDCTDHTRAVVPGGQYKVCCSFQEDDALPFFGPAPKQACVPFDVGNGPFTQNPPDQGNFTNMTLTMQ